MSRPTRPKSTRGNSTRSAARPKDRPSRARRRPTGPPTGRMRLQKFLSDAGVASRRHAEELITEGRVLVNGQIVATLPAFVEAGKDEVIVDGGVVKAQAHQYWILHKPKGVVCTEKDPGGRTKATSLLPPETPRVFAVGRLDVDSTGLLLLTNDGELSQQLTHPRFGIEKVYRVELRGMAEADIIEQLLGGVRLSEGKAGAISAELVHRSRERTIIELRLLERRNRQIQRMFARFGLKVKTLKRTQIGPLVLKGLPVGACRMLAPDEVGLLRDAIEKRSSGRAAAGARGAAKRPTKTGGKKAATKKKRATPSVADRPEPAPPRAPQRREQSGPGRRLVF